MKLKLLISLVAILFVSVLYLLYLNFFKKPEIVYVAQTGNITLPTAVPTISDSTASWKIYENKELSFSFKYPEKYELNNLSLYDKLGNSIYTLNIESNPNNLNFLNFEKESLKNCLKLPNESGEGCLSLFLSNNIFAKGVTENIIPNLGKVYFRQNSPGVEDLDVTAWQKNENVYYFIVKSDKTTAEYSQILSTFKFTDAQQVLPTPTTTTWKSTSINNFSFSYPPEANVNIVNSGYFLLTDTVHNIAITGLIFDNPNNASSPEQYSQFSFGKPWSEISAHHLTENVLVGNKNATRLIGDKSYFSLSTLPLTSYLVASSNKIIELLTPEYIGVANGTSISKKVDDSNPLYQEILSTFKFMN